MTEAMLDLFDPMTLVQTVIYQGHTPSDCWERQHIDAMNTVCEYIQCTYPNVYNRVKPTHDRFFAKAEDF